MSERYAVQDGPWHLASTWDGGSSVPGDADDVHAGGYEVTIHTSVKVKSLRLAAGSSAPAGGRFVVGPPDLDPGITIEVTDGILAAHHQSGNASNSSRTYVLWVLDPGTPVTVVTPTIEGGAGNYRSGVGVNVTGAAADGTGGGSLIVDVATITGGSGSQSFGIRVDSADSTVTITGDITGGTSTAHGLNVTGGTVSVTGDITGGSGGSAYGLVSSGSSVVTIHEGSTITGSSGSNAHGVQHQSDQPITIHATITGGPVASSYGLNLPGNYTANTTGHIIGGSATGAAGVNADANSTLNHTGDVTGSATHNAPGILATGNTKTRISGTIQASEHAPAITGENTIPIAIKHAQNHPNGQAATQCKMWIIWDADDATIGVYTDLAWPDDPEGSAAVLTRFGTDLPAQADVRLNTTYGPGGNLTGTLEAGGASLADIAAVTGAQIQAATNTDD